MTIRRFATRRLTRRVGLRLKTAAPEAYCGGPGLIAGARPLVRELTNILSGSAKPCGCWLRAIR
jgi:hypothetical protein